ncbi:MAG: tetratricopeptide repeat protein [Vicinamibacterales bacterium]
MKGESLAMGVAGAFFGLLVGWIVGAQYASGPARPRAAAAASAPASQGGDTARRLDEQRVRTLTDQAQANPNDPAVRAELGNVYFDAERYTDAIGWYEQAFKLDPKNPDVSTDLGVSYYYTNQPDRALEQFDRSLAVDANHLKTLLNMGIVRAFGKQDLKGAEEAWQKVLTLAPTSPEGKTAKQAIDSLRSAHSGPSAPEAPGSPTTK